MTRSVRHRLIRACIGSVFGALLASGLLTLAPERPAAGQEESIDRVAFVRQWFEARDRGDVDTALAMLTDEAVFVGGGLECSAQAPCTGTDAIREIFELQRQTHEAHRLVSIERRGSAVIGSFEARNDRLRARGFERVLRTFVIQLPRDKITVFVSLLDLTDPESARNSGLDPAPPNVTPVYGWR